MYKALSLLLLTTIFNTCHSHLDAQDNDFDDIRMEVDFSDKLREWDGFGFNYVETAQTIDYEKDPQDYGGFSLLGEKEKQEIIEMVFGEDGLKVGIVKMFLDPWHQEKPGGEYDHETSTSNMREFVSRGVEMTRSRGEDLQIFTTLYGPPPFITKQKFLRGRDFDPDMKDELLNYYVDWVKYLKEHDYPIKYVSLHNEGEDWSRWPTDGKSGNIGEGHDYNMYWPRELINEIIISLRKNLDDSGYADVGVTNGETTNWYRFYNWGNAYALYQNDSALNNLSIVTSHGFYHGFIGTRWYADHQSTGIDLLRTKRPDLKSWVTSTGWGKMDTYFISEMQGSIYTAKVNAIIPWAGIQRPVKWVGGDPNAGAAFHVSEDGSYKVLPGYYLYKQITRAGQPGMAVVRTIAMSTETPIVAFGSDDTDHQDAFVVINNSDRWEKNINVNITGASASKFKAYRTTQEENGDKYKEIGVFELKNGAIRTRLPVSSVTTFFAVEEK